VLVTVRTFNARRGRLSEGRLGVLGRLGPKYGLTVSDHPLELVTLYGRRAPLVLEIGSGMGEATAAMAAADPERDYLAVEVHTAGVANLLALIEAGGLTNVRIARGNALHLAGQQLRPESICAVHAFFPDPWPKVRHHKRRLIQPAHVALLRSRLVPGGLLHCATDSPDYAKSMMDAMGADGQLVNAFHGYAPRAPGRPVTKYERRALDAGRDVFDLMFHRLRRSRSTEQGPA
jgi:tRNA (guanine-N7-)-methyltransferase